MNDLRVASVQFEHQPGQVSANLETMRGYVEQASRDSVDLIVFPECCVSGYWHLRKLSRGELLELSEEVPGGAICQELSRWAKDYGVSIGAGFVERAGERMFNSYVVAMPDGRIVCHRKLHCFISEHLDSGDDYTVFELPDGTRAAILICYDNNLIENVRACALLGAEVLIAPHQTGGCCSVSPEAMGLVDREAWDRREEDPGRIEAEFRGDKGRGWLMRWLPARAHDNGLFVVFSNGVGVDDDEVRTGNAMILDPYGRILAETWAAGDAMVVADLEARLREQCTGVRWILARRPELYDLLTKSTGRERATRDVRFEGISRQ